MENKRRWLAALGAALIPLLLFTLWVIFAPLTLGGSVTYVIVTGNSMEPTFHYGDLVLVRSQLLYRVNEVVVYHNRPLGRYVFHRIIAEKLDRYVLRGDNNPWLDSYLPFRSDILGAYWFHLPKVGVVFQFLRQPWALSTLALFIGTTLFWPEISRRPKRSRKRRTSEENAMQWKRLIDPQKLSRRAETLFFTGGVLFFAGLLASIFAFQQSLWRQVPEDLPYQQLGAFTYSAAGPASLYDASTIHTGEPIFIKAACEIELEYDYKFSAEQPAAIQGTQRLTAIVSDVSGWKRTLPLTPDTPFTGNVYSTTATLDLCQVYQMVADLEEQTGLRRVEYALDIQPHAVISGTINGEPLSDTFAPSLSFRFDDVEFSLRQPIEESVDPLRPVQQGLLRKYHIAPNIMSILGASIPVRFMRVAGVVSLVLGSLGLALLTWIIYQVERAGPAAQAQMRFGPLIVDVERPATPTTRTVVTVARLEDLAKLAERFAVTILHETQNDHHTYWVQGEGITYRYEIDVPQAEAAAEAETDVPPAEESQPSEEESTAEAETNAPPLEGAQPPEEKPQSSEMEASHDD